jgi:hypothetical protein
MRSGGRGKFKVFLCLMFVFATLSSKFHLHAGDTHSGANENHDICATVSCRDYSESHDIKVSAETTEESDHHGNETPITSSKCTNHVCHCLYALPDSAKAPINHIKVGEVSPQEIKRNSSSSIFGMFRPPRIS